MLAPFLAVQAKVLAAQITDAIASTEKADVDPDRVRRILDAIDFSGWVTVADGVARVLAAMAADGGVAALYQIGVTEEAITEQVNTIATAWAKERSAELVGMRYDADGNLIPNPNAQWAISESTRDMLRADVEAAIENGTSTDDLADSLEERYAFSEARAETIARTEIAQADIQGNLIAYKESGVVEGKEVALSSGHNDDDECDDAADMGVVPIDEDFGGLGDPPFHPNCECDVLPVLTAEEE